MFPLFSLATELVISIIESVDRQSDLISLAQTCTKLQPLAEAELFKAIYVRNGHHALSLATALRARPERFEYVQKLKATPAPRNWSGIEVMPSLVREMSNLRELHVESPLINTKEYDPWWVEGSEAEYMDMFQEANQPNAEQKPLRNLQSFTLHSHGKNHRHTQLRTLDPIFFSPTLTYIHLSCVHIIGSVVPPLSALPLKTPLKTLILDECNILPSTLEDLLIFPQNLESLSLQETMQHLPVLHYLSRDVIAGDVIAALRALRHQKHSLQYLQHTCHVHKVDHYANVLDEGNGLSDFRELRTLELSQDSPLVKMLEDPHLAPPGLNTYRFIQVEYNDEELWEAMPDKLSATFSATPLKHLELHLEHTYTGLNILLPIFVLSARAKKLIKIARIAKEKGITTTLVSYTEYTTIYGEPELVSEVWFESDRFWIEEDKYLKEQAKQNKENKLERKLVSKDDDGTVMAAKISAGYGVE